MVVEYRFINKTSLAPALLAAERVLLEASPGDTRPALRGRAMCLGLVALARERGGETLEELIRNELP
jgi:hypothetical protein